MEKKYIDINKKSYDKVYEAGWGNRYTDSNLVSIYYNIICPLIEEKRGMKEKLKCLDFGCSLGANTKFFCEMGFEVYGIDISETAIEKCININHFKRENFVATNILEGRGIGDIFHDIEFDLIIAANVLYYFDDMDIHKVLQQFNAVMNKNAVLYANMHTEKSDYYINKEKNSHNMFILNDTGSINETLYVNTVHDKEKMNHLFDIFSCESILYYNIETTQGKFTEGYHYIGKKKGL